MPFKKNKALKNIGLMLVQRRRLSANIKTAMVQHLVAGMFHRAIIWDIVHRTDLGNLKAFYNYYYFLI